MCAQASSAARESPMLTSRNDETSSNRSCLRVLPGNAYRPFAVLSAMANPGDSRPDPGSTRLAHRRFDIGFQCVKRNPRRPERKVVPNYLAASLNLLWTLMIGDEAIAVSDKVRQKAPMVRLISR